jgi:methionyl aminopeptidase
MPKIKLKTAEQIKIMEEGGLKLGAIRDALVAMIKEGVSAWDVEQEANRLIELSGGKASFAMVPGYSWATCVNLNSGVVHGIPKKTTVFKNGDVVSVDVGLFYKNLHTDTSASVVVGEDKGKESFLKAGRRAVDLALEKVVAGNRIYDISQVLQEVIEGANCHVVRALTGHGIGENLHEEPYVPCFVQKGDSARLKTPEIVPGMVLAVEVMYTQGNGEIETLEDGWTIVTQDGKISALFEETVAVGNHGPIVLTRSLK